MRILRLKRFYFGDGVKWHWKNPIFKRKLGLSRLPNHNMMIVGESGGGKSNACKVIINQLSKIGAHVAVLDPHGEYLGIADSIGADVYDASYNGINIFELDGMSEKEKANELTNLFKRIFRLGEVQGYVLYKCIMYTYNVFKFKERTPNIHDLLYSIKVFKKHANSSEDKILGSLENRLTLLDTDSFSRSISIGSIISKSSIMLLSNLHTNESQAVYMEGMLRKLYSKMLTMEKCSSPKLYIIIDEAAKLGESPILGKITAECRKYGVGVIAISQRLKGIDRNVRSNSSILIAFYQREPDELNYIANFIAGGNELNRFIEVKKALRSLRMGQAVICDSSQRDPIVGQFDICKGNQTSISFEIIDKSRNAISSSELYSTLEKYGFDRLSIKGKIDELVQNKRLHYCEISDTSELNSLWYISFSRNSPEHDICVNLISRYLIKKGIRNEIYNKSFGPDIILYKDMEKIAIEYETGTKSKDQFLKMMEYRQRSYKTIIVVVNDTYCQKYGGVYGIRCIPRSGFFKDGPFSNI